MPDVVQSVPQYGVSLAVLEKLAALGRELAEREGRAIALTTAEISELVVKPMTRDRGCSLAELLEADDGALLREWRGKAGEATVFVSHAWRYRFDEVVETAGAFSRARAEAPAKKKMAQEGATEERQEGEKGAVEIETESTHTEAESSHQGQISQSDSSAPGKGFEEPLFWVDVVVNSQWKCEEKPFEWWCTTFRENVRQIGHTLLVLSPWNAPIPLTRAWCLYELLCTQTTGARLSIQLPSSQHDAFEEALAQDFAAVIDALATIDTERSEAWDPTDREMIFAAVRATDGGFHQLNAMVLDTLRLWLTETALAAVQRRGGLAFASSSPAASNSSPETPHLDTVSIDSNSHIAATADLESARLFDGISKLAYSLADFCRALRFQKAALAIKERLLEPTHPEVLASLTHLGIVLWRTDRAKEALELHRRCHDARRELLGEDHPDALQSQGLMALAHLGMRRYAVAEELYRSTAERLGRVRGADHPDTLYSVAWLGVALQNQGQLEEAEQLHRRCHDARCRVHGPRHYDTLFSLNNLAMVVERQGRLDEAAQLHRECFETRYQTLGACHTSTISSLQSLLSLLAAANALADMKALIRPYWLRVQQHGLSPPLLFVSHGLYASYLRLKGDHDRARACLESALQQYDQVYHLEGRNPYVSKIKAMLKNPTYDGSPRRVMVQHHEVEEEEEEEEEVKNLAETNATNVTKTLNLAGHEEIFRGEPALPSLAEDLPALLVPTPTPNQALPEEEDEVLQVLCCIG